MSNGFTEEWLAERVRNGYVREAGAPQTTKAPPTEVPTPSREKSPPQRKQTKTEAEYGRLLALEFPGCEVRPFALVLYLRSGHRYTPDYVVWLPDGGLLLVEVKHGGYRHPSYGRSRLAFDCARLEFPFQFRWVEKTAAGWEIK